MRSVLDGGPILVEAELGAVVEVVALEAVVDTFSRASGVSMVMASSARRRSRPASVARTSLRSFAVWAAAGRER